MSAHIHQRQYGLLPAGRKKIPAHRQLLEVCNEFNQPVGMITKNAGMLRDKDLLQEMAKKNLVSILVSVTSFNEDLRQKMEPRTTTAAQRIRTIRELSAVGNPGRCDAGSDDPGPERTRNAADHEGSQ